LLSVFLPDRLELIKGAPSLRRAHLDQFVAALWPARTAARKGYAAALAQRNALIAGIRAGRASSASLGTWDRQLAIYGLALMADRAGAVEAIAETFSRIAGDLGLDGNVMIRYRPRSRAGAEDEFTAELEARRESDLQRGFTGHGPHRDELTASRDGHELKAYGSQGQQRLALLALLLAEREAIAQVRDAPPLMLLDDVMSELDGVRRQALVELLRTEGGQSVITTTDLEHVPGGNESGVTRIAVADGQVFEEAAVA
jgi:DNA replication and repair protein RecF